MKLLLDQGLPRTAVAELARYGIVASHVGDLGLAASSDQDILAAADRESAVVVTLDADFHQLLAATRAASPSVIRIRQEGLKGDSVAALLHRVLAMIEHELIQGAVASVSLTDVRVRLLPIGR